MNSCEGRNNYGRRFSGRRMSSQRHGTPSNRNLRYVPLYISDTEIYYINRYTAILLIIHDFSARSLGHVMF